jgi:DNA-binding CsgD family transcriptional regulator
VLEYSTAEATAFTELARARTPAAGVQLVTGGDVEQSRRMRHFMIPHFGFGDEARVMFREDNQIWGAMALFRGPTDAPFEPEEVEFLASLSSTFARGVRTGILTRLAAAGDRDDPVGPAVLIIGADDEILQVTPGAEERLSRLAAGDAAGDPMSPVAALVGAARRYRAGGSLTQPRCRIRTRTGQWLVLHAAPLSASGDRVGEVVVTIEEARPPEIVDIVVAAFGLTARERDITRLVLQGADTKEIAGLLHLSTYTVQDHLKAVFAKADVRSRRELIARVYFEQYVPRMGRELSPSGWFADPSPSPEPT